MILSSSIKTATVNILKSDFNDNKCNDNNDDDRKKKDDDHNDNNKRKIKKKVILMYLYTS